MDTPDFIPDSQFKPDANTPAQPQGPDFVPDDKFQSDEDKYGTPGQVMATVAEGAAEGMVGPLAPLIETKLLHINPEDIRGRKETNPIAHGVSEAGSFGAGLLTGTGEAAMVSHAGEAVAKLLPKTLSKFAATGIKTGAEMAALQTGDEISKTITQDPNQTLGSAAINIGLSGIIGGAGGAVLGKIPDLWRSAANKMGVEKLASDFMGETEFLNKNPDIVQGASTELSGRMAEAEDMRHAMSSTKPEVLAKAMPEMSPANIAKVDTQIQEISDKLTSTLEKATESVKTKSAVPYIAEDLTTWQNVVTNPDAGFAQKFLATNKLKQDLASYAKWGLTEEGSAKADLGRKLASYLIPALEDTKVWGAAADVQRVTNEATTNIIRANKDLLSKLTSKEMGENAIDPAKLQTFLRQVEKGGGNKVNAVKNYLEHTQGLADSIAKVHLDNGLEIPLEAKLNPTPILEHSLNTPLSAGHKLAQWAKAKGASNLAEALGKGAATTVGGLAGSIVGHPIAGGYIGEKILAPTFSVLAKPFAEKAINSEAAKASVDYLGNAIRGQMTLGKAVKSMFKGAGQIIPESLMPTPDSREKLETSLEKMQDVSHAETIGGGLHHYLPEHGGQAAMTAAKATEYLNSLKPKQPAGSPLDTKPPVDKAQQAKYNRALDIAQQPLMVLQHIKDGTLLPEDVTTLKVIYPGLYGKFVSELTNEIVDAKNNDVTIPYRQKLGISRLMGAPLDTTMTQPAMQAIIASVAAKPQPAANQPKSSKTALESQKTVNSLYETPLQAREAHKRQG